MLLDVPCSWGLDTHGPNLLHRDLTVRAAPWNVERPAGIVIAEDGAEAMTTAGGMAAVITSAVDAARDFGSGAGTRVLEFSAAPMSQCEPASMQLRR